MMYERDTSRPADIRRRARAREGGSEHAMRTLFEALRLRGMRLRGKTALLIGFAELEETPAASAAHAVIDALRTQGVTIRIFQSSGSSGAEHRAHMLRALQGSEIVLIDTDSRYIRTLRPKEMRSIGAEIIVPTTLRA